jgi:hypothetical protein
LKLVCKVLDTRNLKPENSQDYAQKLQRNCTFMNSASEHGQMQNTTVGIKLSKMAGRSSFAHEKHCRVAEHLSVTHNMAKVKRLCRRGSSYLGPSPFPIR